MNDKDASRRLFEKLNSGTRGRGVVHARDLVSVPVPNGGRDTDVVNQKIPGGDPNTTIHDGGGGRMGGAEIHVVFWGDAWSSSPPPSPSAQDVLNDIATILASPYLAATDQYIIGSSTAPTKTGASLASAWINRRGVPSYDFTQVDVNYEAWLMMTSGPIDADSYTCVFVIMPPGHNPNPGDLLGNHQWVILPDLRQVPVAFVRFGSRETMSCTFTHELVEVITDPFGDAIQVNPTSSIDWNEIGDACNQICGVLNGVTVQSYWSMQDKACVIPQPVPVTEWEIRCIQKAYGHQNPHEQIKAVAGVHVPSGKQFWMKQEEVIARIDNGDRFVVRGADGTVAQVVVRIHFAPWAPRGNRYIATVADNSIEDNLLSLRDCGQSDFRNE